MLSCLAGCGASDRGPNHLYLRLAYNPTTLDPAHIVDVTGGSIAAKLFNGLVRLDADMRVVPDIAESWKISHDGKNYDFVLRRGVRFTNGSEVTAEDFRYSFSRILDPKTKSPNTWVLEKIEGARAFMSGKSDAPEGIRVIDRYRLRITIERPFSPFLALLTMTAAYVVPREAVERLGPDFSTRPLGTGPYILETWSHNNALHLSANHDYFGKKPSLAGMVYRIIPEDLTAVTEFELGNIDVLGIPASEYRRFRNSPVWSQSVVAGDSLNTYYLGFNCSRPPFDNPRLRRAVASGIDTRKILETFYEQRGRPASGPVPEKLRQWDAPQPLLYDRDGARKIVEAEQAAGMTVTLYVTADQEVVDMAEIIQSYLKEIGLNVVIRQLEWSAYKQAVNRGEADMFWLSWWADYPDAENFLYPLFHSANHGASGNRSFYTNRDVDRLVEEGQGALDPLKQARAYGQAEKVIAEDSPWVFFWHKTDYVVVQPSVRSYSVYPIYSIDKGTEASF